MALKTLPYKVKITSNVEDGLGGMTINVDILNSSNVFIASKICYVNLEQSWPEIESKIREVGLLQMEEDAGGSKLALLTALVNKNIAL